MRLLEKLGWSKKKARPVGDQLETGRSEQEARAQRRKDFLIKAALFVSLVAITLAAFPRGGMYEYTVDVGDSWRQQTLVAPFNFPIYKDAETVTAQKRQARLETPPYFREMASAQQAIQVNRDSLKSQLQGIFDAYASYQYHRTRSQEEQAERDSLRYVELRRNSTLKATPSQWRRLVTDHTARLSGLAQTTRRTPTGSPLHERLMDAAYDFSMQLLNVGVLNLSRDSVHTDVIIVRNEEERLQREVPKDNVYGLNEAYSYVREQLDERFSDTPAHANLSNAFFRAIFEPSLRYMRAETIRERERRAEKITSISGGVQSGEVIVKEGEEVTAETKRLLTSLERYRNEGSATTILWKQLGGELVLTLAIYGIFFLFLFFLHGKLFADNQKLLLITLLFGATAALFGITIRVPWASLYMVPVALVAVQLTIIFNSRVSLYGTLTLCVLGGTLSGMDLEFTLAAFVASMLGVFSVRDIKNRGQFFLSTVLIFLGYLIVLAGSWLYLGVPASRFGTDLMYAAIGASFTITSYFLLWVFERTFDVTTDLTLLELSDTNRPLLKQLSARAPGSFNHSLQVANLAEAAADCIGAHALLARVGALYHDVGKMLKPDYYVENQRSGANPHDQLKPRMSALIIISHVKEGLEMAKEYGLPERITHFIPTHHGTSRIEYFYQKAVERCGDDDSPVMESEFRYPGPRPDSKETGILMLADSIEAASRSLDEPTHNRLKSLIDLIFQKHIEDGQLDDTDLTFRDLREIKETFLSMLTGIYHVRVKYPDQDSEEDAPSEETKGIVEPMQTTPNGMSVLLDGDLWGTPEQSVSADQLRQLPGIRDPQVPRAELAEASPHNQASQATQASPKPSGDGAPDAPPADAPNAQNGTSGAPPSESADEEASDRSEK